MLIELIKKHKLDAIFINEINTIKYLFNFTGSNAFILYTKKNVFFITDARYELQASKEVKNAVVLVYDNKQNFLSILKPLIKRYKINKIGFFAEKTIYAFYLNLKQLGTALIPLSYSTSRIRMVKKTIEIKNIKKAILIQEKAFEKSFSLLFKAPTEIQFAHCLNANILLSGAEKSSFDTIVAFGKNSAYPHHSSSNKKINGVGSIIIDFGAVYRSYSSDQTVTLFFGNVNKKLVKIYDLVYELRARIFELIKPGIKISYLQNFVDCFFDKNLCLKFSKHGLGHGLGLEIHEEPLTWRNSDIVLEENMVFTIEPGLYIPNLGGVRLEDVLLVTNKGHEVLTSIPKEKKYVL